MPYRHLKDEVRHLRKMYEAKKARWGQTLCTCGHYVRGHPPIIAKHLSTEFHKKHTQENVLKCLALNVLPMDIVKEQIAKEKADKIKTTEIIKNEQPEDE